MMNKKRMLARKLYQYVSMHRIYVSMHRISRLKLCYPNSINLDNLELLQADSKSHNLLIPLVARLKTRYFTLSNDKNTRIKQVYD